MIDDPVTLFTPIQSTTRQMSFSRHLITSFLDSSYRKKTDIDLEQILTDLFFALNKEIITRLISDTKGFRLYFIHIRIVHDFFHR